MELKVWVEGIQRVVCGVSDSTTCQDIVYALAHATGQTGRFTLVERCWQNERLLSPHEHPLKVLTKWGEYASNVQFILKRSNNDKKSSNNHPPSGASALNNKRQHDLRALSPTSPPPPSNPISSNHNKELRKSFTFSGSHGGSSTVSGSSGQSTPNSHLAGIGKVETDIKTGLPTSSRQDIPRGVIKGIPQQRVATSPQDHQSHSRGESPVKGKGDRPKQPPSYDEALSRSSRNVSSHQHQINAPQTSGPAVLSLASLETDSSPSSKRRHLRLSSDMSPSRQAKVSSPEIGIEQTNIWENNTVSDSTKNWATTSKDSSKNAPPKVRKSLIGQFDKEEGLLEPMVKDAIKSKEETLSQDPQLRDLIRLVNLQKEKLNSQNAELSQFDSEIGYWETKLQEQEARLAKLEAELHSLERSNSDHDEELSTLEHHQPLFMDSIDKGRQEDRVLRSKLSVLRAQIANCETEVLQCRQRMRHILEEIAEERKRGVIEREEKEQQTKRQLQELEDQLLDHKAEGEKQKSILAKLEEELKQFETDFGGKNGEAEKLTVELREANLQSLSLAITEDNKLVADGNFHNRSGSTRRIMGSPRQLENAVPTSKNPHGVWV